MLSKFLKILAPTDDAHVETEVDHAEKMRVATCVVLLEVAQADDEFSEEERVYITNALRQRFGLSEVDAKALIEDSQKHREQSVDLWQYTHLINETCTREEKFEIVEHVWHVVFADGGISGHETYVAKKLGKLFNLSHPQLMEIKLKALDVARDAG